MANTPTDSQQNSNPRWEIDYWARIDAIDAELSGDPIAYASNTEMRDALGVGDSYMRLILFKLRQRLETPCDKINQDG
ncbi:MAG: hypothetical protein ACPF8W_05165 [Luminiphilus sp.]